ncbi:MAG: sulfurtransferase TusA family protein [Alphaproteobacteria bacterium]|nr:sulfurtransferase TusA family protein [Alphaproteobacteria bacterium]MBF0129489.1 sulfurtransferase TusA family protein [Alphaproteobacteria bacterium]
MSERHRVDARGAMCPGPLMEMIAAIKLAAVGDEIEVLSSDRGTVDDIPEWVAKVGHRMVESVALDGYWSVVVKKAK